MNVKRHRLREVFADDLVTIYQAVKPLQPPEYLDIATRYSAGRQPV